MIDIDKVPNATFLKDDIYEYVKIENCKNYSWYGRYFDVWNEWRYWQVQVSNNNSNIIDYYFIIDTYHHACSAHWIYECLIVLPLYHILKKQYPSLKLVLAMHRDYKRLFTNLYNIKNEDVIYGIKNPRNISFFPKPTNLNYKKYEEYYKILIDNLFNIFDSLSIEMSLIKDNLKVEKIDYLIMPRQKKENFNHDHVSYDNIIKNFKTYKGLHLILNTDNVTDIKQQIAFVRNSDNIILTDGSAYLINGLFVSNKTLHVCGRFCTEGQANAYDMYKCITDRIKSRNKVVFYENENVFIDKNKHLFS
jgi:hypothetical protein